MPKVFVDECQQTRAGSNRPNERRSFWERYRGGKSCQGDFGRLCGCYHQEGGWKPRLVCMLQKTQEYMLSSYYLPSMGGSFSIKRVLPSLYPDDPSLDYHNLEGGVQNGNDAMTIFPKIQYMSPEEQEKTRKALLEYCGLDTYAMVKVWESLKKVWLCYVQAHRALWCWHDLTRCWYSKMEFQVRWYSQIYSRMLSSISAPGWCRNYKHLNISEI